MVLPIFRTFVQNIAICYMTKLSINVNKIATLRNSRGGDTPDVMRFAQECERFGADGISVHPWPDERHIRLSDVYRLRQVLTTDLNIEGYPSLEFVAMVKNAKPAQVTLMPDSPTQLTSNMGWNTEEHVELMTDVISEIKDAGIRTSVFVTADKRMIEFAARAGADRVELYAGAFVRQQQDADARDVLRSYADAAAYAHSLGLRVNAGHELDLQTLDLFLQHVPWIEEVSIGHAFVCDVLYWGLERTVLEYKDVINKKREYK